MRGGFLISALFCAVQALAVAARAEAPVAPSAGSPIPASASQAVSPAPVYQPQPVAETAQPTSQLDPLVQLIRAKLADLRKGANTDDLAALEAFYAVRNGGPRPTR
jgi:hypothetical protein